MLKRLTAWLILLAVPALMAAVPKTYGDFDGDGKADILWRNSANGYVYLMPMIGATVLPGQVIGTVADPDWQIVAVADFQGDGKADLLWRNRSTGEVYLWLLDGFNIISMASLYTEPDTNWKIVGTGDFNGDGVTDILCRNAVTGAVSLITLNGATWGPATVIYTEPNLDWQIVALADFNGDGKTDILWQNASTGQVYQMLMNGGSILGQSVLYTEPNRAWKIAGCGDFNGDGKADILWRNSTTGAVYLMPVVDSAVLPGSVIYTEPNLDWQIVEIADFDGDGKADLLWRNRSTGQVYLMLMSGQVIHYGGMVYNEPNTAWSIQAGLMPRLVLGPSVITASAGAGGSISPSGATSVAPNASQSYLLTPNTGYQVAGITVDGVALPAAASYTFSDVTANHTIAASFSVMPTYPLSITLSAGVTGSPTVTTSYVPGTILNYGYSALTGYTNLKVLVDGVAVPASGTVNMNAARTLAASADLQTFTLTATPGPNGSISPAGTTSVDYGSSQTCAITPYSGYQIASVTVDGVAVGAVSSYAFTTITADHTIAATFSALPPVTLAVSLGTGVTGTPAASGAYPPGTVLLYNYAPQAGYQNLQVTLDGVAVPASGTVTMDGLHVLVASAQVQTFTLTASAGANGSVSPSGAQTIPYGGSQAYTVTPNTGYQVAGVVVDGVAVGAVSFYPFTNVTGNHTLTATFSLIATAPLHVTLGAGVTGTPAVTTGSVLGTVMAYSYSLLPGYTNLQVTLDGAPAPASGTVTMAGPHTLAATADILIYTVTPSAGANGSITPGGITPVNYGSSLNVTITPNLGYQVATVTVDGVPIAPVTSYLFANVTGSHSIAATFAPLPPNSLGVSLGAGVTGTPATTTGYLPGTVVSYAYALQPGYQNLQVTLDGAPVAASGTVTMGTGHLLTVSAQAQSFALAASAGPNGSISPNGTTILPYGDSLSYAITPNTGYQVATLLVDGAAVTPAASYLFPNVAANHTIAATFAPVPTFALNVTLGAGVTGTPTTTVSYMQGTTVNYSFALRTGYQNLQVTLDGVAVPASGTVTLTTSHSLQATAQSLTFSLSATAGANGSVSPAGLSSVNYGATQVCTITPAPGYQVADVQVDGVSVGPLNAYPFVNVTGNHTLSATFSALPSYALSISLGTGVSGAPAAGAAYQQGTAVPYHFSLLAGRQNLQVTLDGVPVPASGTVTMNGAHSLAASSDIQTLSITASATAGGSITPAGTTLVSYGQNLDCAIAASAGSYLTSVLIDGAATTLGATYSFANITSNHTIQAIFSRYYKLNAGASSSYSDPNGNGYSIVLSQAGTIPYAGGKAYPAGASVSYSVIRVGNVTGFQVWLDGAKAADAGTIIMNGDHSLYATYQ